MSGIRVASRTVGVQTDELAAALKEALVGADGHT
jgi:hypothetical protein